nr:hypothetical protein SYMBAF_20335 [Serratia symbiotica]
MCCAAGGTSRMRFMDTQEHTTVSDWGKRGKLAHRQGEIWRVYLVRNKASA